jgi:hypothetical protein
MNCCHTNRKASAPAAAAVFNSKTRSWPRRVVALIQWAVPVVALALVPKCPMCVAAYCLLFTGIGLSLTAATAVRWTIIAFSVAALASLVVRAARRGSYSA